MLDVVSNALYIKVVDTRMYTVKIFLIFCFFALCMPGAAFAKDAPIPTWIDTVPPLVSVAPHQKYHSSVMTVTLKSNKIASLYVAVNSRNDFALYRRPMSITKDGSYTVYYYGIDDFGNKSVVDSIRYVLDTRPPQISLQPASGIFRNPVLVKTYSDEPVSLVFSPDTFKMHGHSCLDTITVTDSLVGYFIATDSSGNSIRSMLCRYRVDTTRVKVSVIPNGGTYKVPQILHFASEHAATIFYTFDESALPEKFFPIKDSLETPFGLVDVRYYGVSKSGVIGEIEHAVFKIDTIPPRIRLDVSSGLEVDTLTISINEKGSVYYTLDKTFPVIGSSTLYQRPLIVPRRKKVVLHARALDLVKNQSELFTWEKTYEIIPPSISLSVPSGLFNKPIDVNVVCSKKAAIHGTTNTDSPSSASPIINGPIRISREGLTVLRVKALDDADNWSNEAIAEYTIDTKPPYIHVSVDQGNKNGEYLVWLMPDESCTVYYEIGENTVSAASPVYREPISLHGGEVLRYCGVDIAGNRSTVQTMEDLKKPVISAMPGGGAFSRRVRVGFFSNMAGSIYWRIVPDTAWKIFSDSVLLDNEGRSTLEYYLKASNGIESPWRRNEYVLDWTPPHVDVTFRKGVADSVSVFFDYSERATIYYTIDGSDPRSSKTGKIAGNVFGTLSDRISMQRTDTARLGFFAEDELGNASKVYNLDLARPHAVPDLPSGIDRVYRQPISITLNTIDERAQIFYAHHARVPTVDSLVFSTPITLTMSDTLIAFVLDASGFVGPMDTFVYSVILPLTPRFVWSPDTPLVNIPIRFDASPSLASAPLSQGILFRWKFGEDSSYAVSFSGAQTITRSFPKGGMYRVSLQIKSPQGDTTESSRLVYVKEVCPHGMVFVADSLARSFCIDAYEWPNAAKQIPATNVSWVEASVYCMGMGKRLCTSAEWKRACQQGSNLAYPYGSLYNAKMCATQSKKISPSGNFARCTNAAGVYDMVGNAWEWVSDQVGDYPHMMGGDYTSGKNAHCKAQSNGSVAARSSQVGLRCCQ